MQDTVRFPQVWPVYSGPAGLPLLRIGRVIGKIAVAPKGVPSSLSDHVGIIPLPGHLALFQSATPRLKAGASGGGIGDAKV